MLSFVLMLVAYGTALPKFNRHFGVPGLNIIMGGKSSPEGTIWLALAPDENSTLVAVSDDRQVMRWNRKVRSTKELKDLRSFLEDRIRKLTLSAVLAKKIFLTQTTVVLSVDRSLVYADVRPIIYLLGEMGFSHYAFETKKPTS